MVLILHSSALRNQVSTEHMNPVPQSLRCTHRKTIFVMADINNDGYTDILNPDVDNIYWFPNAAGGGCIDVNACSYEPNPFNTWDDWSCCYFCGCMDPMAYNFSSSALCARMDLVCITWPDMFMMIPMVMGLNKQESLV